MGLTYRYRFTAPSETTTETLAAFLKEIGSKALQIGYTNAHLLNVPFDNPERRAFAKRIGARINLEPECITASHAVLLVLADTSGMETTVGFARFDRRLNGEPGEIWHLEDHVKTPDPRLRKLVGYFTDAGYTADVHDDFHHRDG